MDSQGGGTRHRSKYSITVFPGLKYDFGALARGYRFAANATVTQLVQQLEYQSFKAYPIIFLYRQSFEFYLKDIICWSIQATAPQQMKRIKEKLQGTQDLNSLAAGIKKILLKTFPQERDLHRMIAKIAMTAQEISLIDPAYHLCPSPPKVEASLTSMPRQDIDILSLAQYMESFLEELETVFRILNAKRHQAQALDDLDLAFLAGPKKL